MADSCSRTQVLTRTLPLTVAGTFLVTPPAYSLTQATAVAQAMQAFYEDEPDNCFVTLPTSSPLPNTPIQYPLELAAQREAALHGILSVLEPGEKPATARHLFGSDLKVLRWALRSEKVANLLVGWLYAATFSDLNGIEEPVMALAESGATPQVRAGALVALLLGMPDRILKAHDPRVRALAQAAADATDTLVREQGQWLLARANAVASGTPASPGTLPTPPVFAGGIYWPGVAIVGAAVAVVGGLILRRRWVA